MLDLEAIKDRIQTAEYAAIHVGNNSAIWFRYYEDSPESNCLIRDFRAMVKEIDSMRATISDLENQVEALGGKVG